MTVSVDDSYHARRKGEVPMDNFRVGGGASGQSVPPRTVGEAAPVPSGNASVTEDPNGYIPVDNNSPELIGRDGVIVFAADRSVVYLSGNFSYDDLLQIALDERLKP